MATYLFTWNPEKWNWNELPHCMEQVNVNGNWESRWSCGVTKKIRPGDRAFLMRLGISPKGLLGSGWITTEPMEFVHWDKPRATKGIAAIGVTLVFDVLSDVPLVGEKELHTPPLSDHHWFPQASGTQIPDDIAEHLEKLWSSITHLPVQKSTLDLPQVFKEGRQIERLTRTYERDPQARQACINKYGTRCFVCALDFQERYGELGKGFIHVHHLELISASEGERELDAERDLRPVCPNCHAMLHRRTPPFLPEELKKMIKGVWR